MTHWISTWTKRIALSLRRHVLGFVSGVLALSGVGLLLLSPRAPPPAPVVSLDPVNLRPRTAPSLLQTDDERVVERVVASMYREADSQRWEVAQVTAHSATASHSIQRVGLTGKGAYLAIRQALANVLSHNLDVAMDRLVIARRSEEPGRVDVEADWSILRPLDP